MSEDVELIRPVLLLADSQLLFAREAGGSFVREALRLHEWSAPRAAYLGACNGDVPEFYDLFVAAMAGAGVHDCRQIPAEPTGEDLAYLRAANVVLVAGGEPRRGWEAFKKHRLHEVVRERYAAGAALIGVSAGAVLLGKRAWDAPGPTDPSLFGTLKVVPFVVSAHEGGEWPQLREAVRLSDPGTSGIGLAAGGGALYHPDHTLQPLGRVLIEIWKHPEEETLHESLLQPGVPPEALPEPQILDTRALN